MGFKSFLLNYAHPISHIDKEQSKQQEQEVKKLYQGLKVSAADQDGTELFNGTLQGIEDNASIIDIDTHINLSIKTLPQLQEDIPIVLRGYDQDRLEAVYIKGTLAKTDDDTWKIENIHDIHKDEGRTAFRQEVNTEATIKQDDCEDPCKIINLSVNGAYIEAYKQYNQEKPFTLTFKLDSDEVPFIVKCKILHTEDKENPKYTYGCKYDDLKTSEQGRLQQALFIMQRKKRNSAI